MKVKSALHVRGHSVAASSCSIAKCSTGKVVVKLGIDMIFDLRVHAFTGTQSSIAYKLVISSDVSAVKCDPAACPTARVLFLILKVSVRPMILSSDHIRSLSVSCCNLCSTTPSLCFLALSGKSLNVYDASHLAFAHDRSALTKT